MKRTLASVKEPLVSVVCLTFNHEPYVKKTIEGFLAQKVNFPFEILIHDDASTDGTKAVIADYQSRYPDLITVLSQSVNQYSTGVRVPALVFEHARGQFIAYCEGDDYWTDPLKLQKQADYLKSNHEVVAIFTDANHLFQQSGKMIYDFDKVSRRTVPQGDVRSELLLANPYKTCTSMFRKSAVAGYEIVARKLKTRMDDLVMWLMASERGRFAYMNETTATYRILSESASHFTSFDMFLRFRKNVFKLAIYFNKRFGGVLARDVLVNQYRKSVFKYCIEKGDYRRAKIYAVSGSDFLYSATKVELKGVVKKLIKK